MKMFYFSALMIGVLCNTAQSQRTDTVQHISQLQSVHKNLEVKPYRYKDLMSGVLLDLRYDVSSERIYDAVTGNNIDFCINTSTGDTVTGKGFYIVNHYLQKHDGVYGIDRTKVDVRGKKMWSIKSNKELQTDEGSIQFYKTGTKATARN